MQSVKPVLIDTSAWISYLRKSIHPAVKEVENSLRTGTAALCGAIAGELFQGAKTEKEAGLIEDLCAICVMLRESDTTWGKAGRLSRKLRKKGHTIPLLDFYIYILARENHAGIITLDEHFKIIEKHAGPAA